MIIPITFKSPPLLFIIIIKEPVYFDLGDPFWGDDPMSGLDNLIAFIDNGGTRSGSERRRLPQLNVFPKDEHDMIAEAVPIVEEP